MDYKIHTGGSFLTAKKTNLLSALGIGENLSDIDWSLNPNQIMDNILLVTKNAINSIFPVKRVSRKQA